jgi:phosphoenolpyruvate carboxylase
MTNEWRKDPTMAQTDVFWQAADQGERLDELTTCDEQRKDLALRRDVRSLGKLLGVVIHEQEGEATYEAEEELRRLAIRHRELHDTEGEAENPEAAALLARSGEIIGGMTVAESRRIVKAFATFFELTNLAETNHRKRRSRAHRVAGVPDKPGSLRATLGRMRDAGIGAAEALKWLERVEVVPVFTAHPTEVARRVVLFKRRRIASELERLDRLPLANAEAEAGQEAILAEIAALWQSDEVRRRQPTVQDEITMGLDHYSVSLLPPLAAFYEDVAKAFGEIYQVELDPENLPTVVRFGSWIGGDRDGNPFVTAASTGDALQKARELIVADYLNTVEELRRLLTPATSQVGESASLRERLEHYATELPEAAREADTLPTGELYRRLLDIMRYRLRRTLAKPGEAAAYPDAGRLARRPGTAQPKPAGAERGAPGPPPGRPAAAQGRHLRPASAHPRYPSACESPRASRGGARRRRRPGRRSCRPAAAPTFGVDRRAA